VAPGESATIDLFVNAGNGATTFSATFTNVWPPKLDLSEVTPPLANTSNQHEVNVGATIEAIEEAGVDEPDVTDPASVDISKLKPATTAVARRTPTVETAAESNGSPLAGEIEVTDLISVVIPVFTFGSGTSLDLETQFPSVEGRIATLSSRKVRHPTTDRSTHQRFSSRPGAMYIR
jgi:hypothetical protein